MTETPETASPYAELPDGGEPEPADAPPADAGPDHEETLAVLRDEWGETFEDNIAFAQNALATFADTGIAAALEEAGLGDDPRIIRAAAGIGRLLRGGGDTASDPEAREALEAELETLTGATDYWTDRVQRRVRRIYLQLYGGGDTSVHRDAGDAGVGH